MATAIAEPVPLVEDRVDAAEAAEAPVGDLAALYHSLVRYLGPYWLQVLLLATEEAINATLQSVGQGRIVVSVTHRLSSVRAMDRIFVLDRGVVVEQGAHDELLALEGAYAGLWNKQSGVAVKAEGRAVVDPAWLRAVPVFAALRDPMLALLAGQFATEEAPAGRTVIYEGDPGNKFYVVVRGQVEVTTAHPNGARRRLAVLQDGDFFGEAALIRHVPRTASVRALCPTVFLTLDRGQFTAMLDRFPEVRLGIESISHDRDAARRSPPGGSSGSAHPRS